MMTSFLTLFTRDLREQRRSRRVQIGLAAIVAVCALAAAMRISAWRDAERDHAAAAARWAASIREQIGRSEAVELESHRRTSPLALLSNGFEPLLPRGFTSTKQGLRFGDSLPPSDAFEARYGHLDLATIVAMLMSLFALALSFDAIAADRARGTLVFLLSYPVRRSTIVLSRFASIVTVLAIALAAAEAVMAAAAFAARLPAGPTSHWLAFYAAALIYLAMFVACGLAISASFRSTATVATAAIAFWCAVVWIAPRAVSFAIAMRWPSADLAALARREDAAVSQLRLRYRGVEQEKYAALAATGDAARMAEFIDAHNRIESALARERELVVRGLTEEHRVMEGRRDREAELFELASPASIWLSAASDLAWTGAAQRARFLEAARDYDHRVGRRLAESRALFFAVSPAGGMRALETVEPLPNEVQPFATPWTESHVALRHAARAAFACAAFDVAALLMAMLMFARTDVRP